MIVYELLVIAALIVTNGLFAGAEIAVLSVRPVQLQQALRQADRRALAVQRLRDQPERFLATVQIGITVVGAAAAAFGGATLAADLAHPLERLGVGRYAEQLAFAVVIALVSWLSLVFGELVPKSLALRSSQAYAFAIARPLLGLSSLMRPLVWFLTFCSNLVLRGFGDRTTFTESRVSREELQQLVADAAKLGAVHPQTSAIAARALSFEDVRVAELMVPRPSVVALPRGASAATIRQAILEEGHSRMPVYDGTPDTIVGYVVARDVMALAWDGDLLVFDDILRPAWFVDRQTHAVEVLRELQRRRLQMAIVTDEAGAMVGVVTIEDLVEELVGDIFNEADHAKPELAWAPDGTALVPGVAQVRRVNRALGLDLTVGPDHTTIAGVCVALVGGIPAAGARLTAADGTVLEVIDASPRRVRTVRLRRPTGA